MQEREEDEVAWCAFTFGVDNFFDCGTFLMSRRHSKKMDTSSTVGESDMTDITEIDEIGINNNLKLRYENDIIYYKLYLFLNK
ncbi:hypothetical protein FF38_14095 [Lucilia cuprina]|uniref:Uncharacterized protein n=1 Tax=Lucilia cuprina TaxID=7375 RepID=A0A0L0BSP0_LUCCU|nr:hypothetical protein FF38_14095 [Lucilia cuprina]